MLFMDFIGFYSFIHLYYVYKSNTRQYYCIAPGDLDESVFVFFNHIL